MFISLSALSLCDEKYYIRFRRILQGVLEKFSKRFSGQGSAGSRYLALATGAGCAFNKKGDVK